MPRDRPKLDQHADRHHRSCGSRPAPRRRAGCPAPTERDATPRRRSHGGRERTADRLPTRGTCCAAPASAPTPKDVADAVDGDARAARRPTRCSTSAAKPFKPGGTRHRATSTTSGSSTCSRRKLRCRRSWCSSGTTTSRPAIDKVERRQADGATRTGCCARNCKGNFKDFVKAINKNAAMMEFLDTVRNRKDDAERELRARAAGAVHARRQGLAPATPQLHAGRHRPDRARLHRLATTTTSGDAVPRRRPTTTIEADYPDARPEGDLQDHAAASAPAGRELHDQRRGRAARSTRVIDIIFAAPRRARAKNTVARRIARRLIEYFAHPSPASRVRRRGGRRLGLRHRPGTSPRCCARSSCTTTST